MLYDNTLFSAPSFCITLPSVVRSLVDSLIRSISYESTMSAGAAAPPSPTMAYVPPDGDPVFGFLTTKWIEPPAFASIRHEIDEDRQNCLVMETTYRQHTTPTAWYRYCTLGRFTVDGNTFDTIWNEFEVDPLRAHCMIWYNYMFHVDRNMDIPSKLESWATKRSQVYLAIHAASVLTVDTIRTSWKTLTIANSMSTPWTTVGNLRNRASKQSKMSTTKSNSTQLLLPFKRASSVLGELPTPTIEEEKETDNSPLHSEGDVHNSAGPQKPSSVIGTETASQASSTGWENVSLDSKSECPLERWYSLYYDSLES